jgi:hypothetical protein
VVRLATTILTTGRWPRLFLPASWIEVFVIQPMDLLLLAGWSALATPLLAMLGFGRILREPRSFAMPRSVVSSPSGLLFLLPRSGSWLGLPLFSWNAFLPHPGRRRQLEVLIEKLAKEKLEFSFRAMQPLFSSALPLRCFQAEASSVPLPMHQRPCIR